ncbi:hypothetical protein [Microbacterium sp. PMB16]|uniref:hypothetical protein n=1 Tax=Microbacterium sp. PMB16 TaxID=3120157 RepID=UPI003F4C6D58
MSDRKTERRSAFAEAFSGAITARGVSLSWLHRTLTERANPISVATLSYWRSGERHPEGSRSLAALEDIEHLLGLDAGSLLNLINTRTRLGPLAPARNPFTETQVAEAAEETLALLDAPPIDVTRDLSAHIVSEVDENGVLRSRRSQILVQAVAPFVHEVTYSLMSADVTIDRPDFALRGATLVRDHLHPSGHVYACVLQLDTPLVIGGTTMLEVTAAPPPSSSVERPLEDETGAFVMRPIRDLVVWTRFHRDALPDWIDEIERVSADSELIARPLRPQESVHQSRRDFGPGILGVRWGFDR